MVMKDSGLHDAELRKGKTRIIGGLYEGCLDFEDTGEQSLEVTT